MPRTPTIKPFKDSKRKKPWRVDIPASISPQGKRLRFYFATKPEAEEEAEKQRIRFRNFGVSGSSILAPSEQEQAANALELLKPYGVTLNEIVHEWISRKQAAEASITFEAAMDAFKDFRTRSESYTRSIRQTKTRLTKLHGKMLNQITPADLIQAMDGMTPSVHNFTIRILGGLFNFGAKRDYCTDNPTKKLDLAQQQRKEIQIYTPEEVAKILRAAEAHESKLVPFLALSFFTGIRLSEIQRLDWSAIDLHEKFLKLPAAITKTKQGRHIDISDSLAAWLNSHVKESGKVVPCSPESLRNLLEALKEHHGVATIKHGPRHCFASYWLAEHGDINQLCRYLGHDDPETTFRHYAKAATKRDALKFSSILPSKKKPSRRKGDKILDFKKEAA